MTIGSRGRRTQLRAGLADGFDEYWHGSKRGQEPLCEAPYGPFRQRFLTPF
jgi:hypothetical protein